MMTEKKRIALFPGSFNPFTRGHHSIVRRALDSIADEIVVAIGINAKKTTDSEVAERLRSIESTYQDNPRVKVMSYTCLTTDLAQQLGASFILRGVRSVIDFEYERNIAEVNRRLTGIETVMLFTEPDLGCVSSSIVRELQTYGKDVTDFLP